ncbi:permease prefix domain 1-containing protein [Bacillus sp. JCM 19041]|uniref:permease prefix domain 1-containing protein n=1 Tax=Bacillus sp. JCM 19041 TaxID=1460637 RepID=UPI0006CF4AA0
MSSKIDAYLQRIINQTDCTKHERKDMYEEMHGHLTMLRQEYIDEGYTKKEAEEMAMKEFGHEAVIGDGLQQAMFPYRRELLLVLALGSYLFICVQYFYVLLTENVANNWMFIPSIAHVLLLFFALNQTYVVNRKLWLNLSLVLNLILMFLFAFPDFAYNPTWSIVFYVLLALTIFLIYRTALTYSSGGNNLVHKRVIHVVNITIGFLITVGTGFFSFWLSLIWWPTLVLLNFLIPYVIWSSFTLYKSDYPIKTKNGSKRVIYYGYTYSYTWQLS